MSSPKLKKLKRLAPREPEQKITRILYIEDTEVIRDTISRLLELHGYDVAFAKNGQEGLDKIRSWRPNVILMDLRMPIMDGFQAIEEIRANPSTKYIPVIVISAWSGKTERTQAKIAGANAFFAKPPDLNRLIETIEELLTTSPN